MPGFLTFLSSIFDPIEKIVNDVQTTDQKKLELKASIFQLQNQLSEKMMDYESQLLAAKADVIKAEATGASWIQRNWRPITMLTFLVLVVCDSFGWLPNKLAPQAWSLLQIGLGGYVVGRSAEKIAPSIAKAMKG